MTNNLWHPMTEEPLQFSVILFSKVNNNFYNGEYIGNNEFLINGIVINKSQFTCWAKKSEFFVSTNLTNFTETNNND